MLCKRRGSFFPSSRTLLKAHKTKKPAHEEAGFFRMISLTDRRYTKLGSLLPTVTAAHELYGASGRSPAYRPVYLRLTSLRETHQPLLKYSRATNRTMH